MLSDKLTLSLTFLVMVLAIGLVLTPAFGDGDHHITATFTPGELMDDVSTVDHADITDIQVESGRDRTSAYPTAVPNGPIGTWYAVDGTTPITDAAYAAGTDGPVLSFSVDFNQVVQLHDVPDDTVTPSGGALGLDDFTVDAYDDLFRSLGTLNLSLRTTVTGETTIPANTATSAIVPVASLKFKTPRVIDVQDPGELPGQQFTLTIHNRVLQNAYNVATGGQFEIHYLLITMNHGAAVDASIGTRTAAQRDAEGDHPIGHSTGPHFIRVDLVEKDEGDPKYMKIVSGGLEAAMDGDPGVVAVSKVIDRSLVSAVETGPFDIRIMLTEQPREFTASHIRVKNGTASEPSHLLPIPSPGGMATAGTPPAANTEPDARFATIAQELGLNYYDPGTPPATVAQPAFSVIPADFTGELLAANTGVPGSSFPRATGRDNAYHLYSVTITPNPGHNGFVTISVNNFEDQVLPTPNMFDALTDAELVADKPQLSDAVEAERSRRAMNGREVLEVRVNVSGLKDPYEASQKELDNNPTFLKVLPEKLVIPANGYLVLASGADEAATGIKNVSADKRDDDGVRKPAINDAQWIYNVNYGFSLPFPADNLSNFFRNGGTLQVLHADVPEATISDENQKTYAAKDEAKEDKGKDYGGATTGSYAANAVIISEIMWGLDTNDTTAQYIELHNTTAADIGIDKNEWVIAVGDGTNARFSTQLDVVGNNPASGYWEVPGSDGVSEIEPSAGFFTLVDIVSMARIVTDGTDDGTAQASWVASGRTGDEGLVGSGIANLSGRRIGTPGAMNSYVMPTMAPTTPEPTPEPMAPAAEADDIMISEVMVASNGGRLPQWVELANVSGAAVSLTGWSLVVENDSADADVVGAVVEIKLDGVEIGEDQVALVVTKEGRNSGVSDRSPGDANEGDLDSNRIINVQSAVSADNARYSLISEMGFMLTLMPPQTGAVRTYGDSGGNLDMGWDLPMSEEGRSSLIRREMGDAGEIMGTDAAGWVLASDTSLNGAYRTTYYGSDEDMGTPGYNAGGALPVELSLFSAKRDPLTDQVVITWETQSELNNAGFFIKRSQQKDGNFVPVNAVMVPGAGTTAEKQSYVYTDHTAKPNVVYYYQIEDVSLDGNRQTLTRSHRLKGHIGAAGKLTTIWGELKSQE